LKQLFRKSIIFVSHILQNLYKKLEDVVFKLDKFIAKKGWKEPEKNSSTVVETLSAVFESTDAFKNEFDKYMHTVLQVKPDYEKYRELLYYNFSLRYFIAYYESRFDTIPLQVYNEYRMAYDHFMRFFIDEKDAENNWDKALSHTRRGVLDILKLNCFWLQEFISQRHRCVPKKALDFISNGEYVKIYSKLHAAAEVALWEAKRKEIEISSDSEKNIETVGYFIKAFLAYLRWDEHQHKNMGNTAFIAAKYRIKIAFRFMGIAAILKVAYDNFGKAIMEFVK